MPKRSKRKIMRKPELDYMMGKADPTMKALMAMLWLFGKRISEVINVRREDVWIEGDKLYVAFWVLKKKSRKDPGDVEQFVKSMSVRHPYMKPLVDYINSLPTERNTLLFPFDRHKAYRMLKKINPRAFLHLFRTSLATRMAELGATEYELMHWFDWDRSSTAGRYVKRTAKLAERWTRREF